MAKKMDRALKKKWIKALRSGDYEQGKSGFLLREDDLGTYYCCIGVLGHIQGCDLKKQRQYGRPMELNTDTLPNGFNGNLSPRQRADLAARNDGVWIYMHAQHSFEQIADHIEETL
jgi:hypothetical protein